jgi:hypothetical protein
VHRGESPSAACCSVEEQLNLIGFGVHISFVRSITMDKWSEEQVKKMKVGESSLVHEGLVKAVLRLITTMTVIARRSRLIQSKILLRRAY